MTHFSHKSHSVDEDVDSTYFANSEFARISRNIAAT